MKWEEILSRSVEENVLEKYCREVLKGSDKCFATWSSQGVLES